MPPPGSAVVPPVAQLVHAPTYDTCRTGNYM